MKNSHALLCDALNGNLHRVAGHYAIEVEKAWRLIIVTHAIIPFFSSRSGPYVSHLFRPHVACKKTTIRHMMEQEKL